MASFPNPFLLVTCDVCSFTAHSKEYLTLQHTSIINRLLEQQQQPILFMCDVFSFTFHLKECLKLNLTPNQENSESVLAY